MSAWQRAVDRIESTKSDLLEMHRLGNEGMAALAREAIARHRGVERYWDLELLKLLDRRAIPHLVDELVGLITFEQHAGQVLDLLNRLDRPDIERLVPPAVERRRDGADSWDLLQLGGLLRRLCLQDALRDFVAFTASSGDEEIQRIGPEYFPEVLA
jgi:hypothetical protein